MLNVYEEIPVGLLQCEARELHQLLPGPSLIHIPGEMPQPLFVSVLLHGNETSGWDAVRTILQDYQGRPLPRALSLFIGNVAAAGKGVRHLENQPDYNRIWKAQGHHEEEVMVRQVLEIMQQRDVFACIDVHNNSGRNPHYACINRLAAPFFDLATRFSNIVVYFLQPDSVLSLAFSNLCPAVTIECGQPGEGQGVEQARAFILDILHSSALAEEGRQVGHVDVFHTVAVVKLNPGVRVGRLVQGDHLELYPELDQLNFRHMPVGTAFGRVNPQGPFPVQANNEFNKNVAERYFEIRDGELVTKLEVMPSMLTLDRDIIVQDCLCYLMEKLDLAKPLSA